MSGERWLVTGGAGFVGVNLLRALGAQGVAVRVLDSLVVGRRDDLTGLGAELVVGDVRDAAAVDAALDGVSVVVHLAAHTRVMDSIADPLENFDVNARGTLVLLDGARRRGTVRRFVLASTGGALLGDATPPVHEELPARPLSPYGAGKLACEGYCSAYFGAYGLETVALRFANVYGPWSYQKASVVAAFLKRVQAGEPLVIYGDGRQTRDFLFVGDLCRAVLAAADASRAVGGHAFHVASGRETTIASVAEQILAVTGARVPVVHEPARRGEVERNCARIGKARAMLGWEPRTPLAEGLAATWDWFRTHGA